MKEKTQHIFFHQVIVILYESKVIKNTSKHSYVVIANLEANKVSEKSLSQTNTANANKMLENIFAAVIFVHEKN